MDHHSRGLVLLMVLLGITTPTESADRSFSMGFSPWPFEATQVGVNWVWDTILANGDMVSQHIEEGVPWNECLNGTPFSQDFAGNLQDRRRRSAGKVQLLQLNAMDAGRRGLAPIRGDHPNQPLTSPWDTLTFDSQPVKTAYANYVKRMIDSLSPDFLLIGVESNLLIRNHRTAWPAYVRLMQHTSAGVRVYRPNLPIGVSLFCVPFFPQWSSEDTLAYQLQVLSDMNPLVDFFAFSVHPFMCGLMCESFPADYFDSLFAFTSKPVAISESSYPAQVWTMPGIPWAFNGSPAKQSDFLDKMLAASAAHNALFAVWYAVRDYDTLWHNTLADDPNALPWRDTGLFDEAGNQRPAMSIWRTWLNAGTAVRGVPGKPASRGSPFKATDNNGSALSLRSNGPATAIETVAHDLAGRVMGKKCFPNLASISMSGIPANEVICLSIRYEGGVIRTRCVGTK